MSKITLNDVGSIVTNPTSAAATIDANSSTIQTAFDNTLSRDGTSPNQMGSNLDMNSHQILNLPNPATVSSPLRLQDLNKFIGGGTINTVPAGGGAGTGLIKNSSTDYDMAWSANKVVQGPVSSTIGNIPLWNNNAGTLQSDSGVPAANLVTASSANAFSNKTIDTAAPNTIKINGNTLSATAGTATVAIPNTNDTLVGRNTTDTLANKTLTTPVINGASSGTGVSTTASPNTLVLRDGSGNSVVNSVLTGYTTTATAAGTTTLTGASTYNQYFTGSTTQTVVLPVTSTLSLGQSFRITNLSTGAVTIQSSGLNTVTVVPGGGCVAIVSCILTSGTTASSWNAVSDYELVASGKVLTVSNSLTLAGTDGTTMTFPSTSATIARTDSANTFTGHQTIEGVTSTGATGTGRFVFDTSPTLTTPTIGAATATTLAFSPTTGGIIGTATNNNTNAGNVGEYVESVISSASAISLSSGIPLTITSISLTAGDWDVCGVIDFITAASTSVTQVGTSVSLTNNSFDSNSGRSHITLFAATVPGAQTPAYAIPTASLRFSLSGTTTIYLVAFAVFTVSTLTGYGIIRARRMR